MTEYTLSYRQAVVEFSWHWFYNPKEQTDDSPTPEQAAFFLTASSALEDRRTGQCRHLKELAGMNPEWRRDLGRKTAQFTRTEYRDLPELIYNYINQIDKDLTCGRFMEPSELSRSETELSELIFSFDMLDVVCYAVKYWIDPEGQLEPDLECIVRDGEEVLGEDITITVQAAHPLIKAWSDKPGLWTRGPGQWLRQIITWHEEICTQRRINDDLWRGRNNNNGGLN